MYVVLHLALAPVVRSMEVLEENCLTITRRQAAFTSRLHLRSSTFYLPQRAVQRDNCQYTIPFNGLNIKKKAPPLPRACLANV